MMILSTLGWDEDYALLDSGGGSRLERFGVYTLIRPDPQCIWNPHLPSSAWKKADAVFTQEGKKGYWLKYKDIPEKWEVSYKGLSVYAKLSPFKHTGIFPEQHIQWDWLEGKVKSAKLQVQSAGEKIRVLNLFGYTGIASLICAQAGAEVTHVDASFPTIGWARDNQALSHLSAAKIRWVLDDCVTFMKREIRRGNVYDGILMDPPVFGHGPKGERWEFSEGFPHLLALAQKLLSPHPLFILINAYAVSSSAIMLENILEDLTKDLGGHIEAGELALQEKTRHRLLSTGIFGRWSKFKG